MNYELNATVRGNPQHFRKKGGSRMKRDEMVVGIVIFIFGGISALLSLRMPIGTFRDRKSVV